MDKRRRWWLIAISALVMVLVGFVLFVQVRPGIVVTIENTGTTPLKSVVVHVTGASYKLGDIAPGDSANVRVRPKSDSNLEIEFKDADGQAKRLNAGGYFESGYRGTIRVSIKDGTIDKFEEDIKLW